MNFGEKEQEYDVKSRQTVPTWQSPKYKESKEKAIEMINSKKFGLSDGDFWILKNMGKGKNGPYMQYSGLIISHNGCLKINDKLDKDKQFLPECVSLDKDGYSETLVYTYCSEKQGLYEVGEVSAQNCKNAYPYAMAVKRLFDRVVLKMSKLAYAGIYSEEESDDFKRRYSEDTEQPKQEPSATSKPQTIDKIKVDTLRKELEQLNFTASAKTTEKQASARYHRKSFADFTILEFKDLMDRLSAAIEKEKAKTKTRP